MNKDVIYIEPEDDITDIITKVKGAREKVVALVPPKKAGVLRSTVNTKLIAKAARTAEKNVVIVTTDAALTKLAVGAGIPIAKTLNSRPVMPTEAELTLLGKKNEEVINEKDEGSGLPGRMRGNLTDAGEDGITVDKTDGNGAGTASDDAKSATAAKVSDVAKQPVGSGKSSEKSDPNPANRKEDFPIPGEKGGKSGTDKDGADKDKDNKDKKDKINLLEADEKKGKKSKIPDLEKYRKFIIAGILAVIAIVVFSVWAFAIAPAATITVTMETTSENFSELAKFTYTKADESVESGIFYLQEVKDEQKASTHFKATGTKDMGAKATGKLDLTATMTTSRTEIAIPAGTKFTYDGLVYTNNNPVTFALDEQDDCTYTQMTNGRCTIKATIAATAEQNGENYNINPHSSGWSTSISGITVANSEPFTGGSSKVVTVVQQSDVDAALNNLSTSAETTGLSTLKEKFDDDIITIDSSYAKTVGDPVVSPAVGEEVADGVSPKIEVTTTYSMYGVEKSVVKKYIKARVETEISSDQKIYSLGSPFFENYDGGAATARLKSTVQVGPKISESEILEKVKGLKVGEVQSTLKVEGVKDVKVATSYFWVNSVPDDPNKITIDLTVNQ